MDCSSPGLLVHHQLPELTQTHVFRIGDAIQFTIFLVMNMSGFTEFTLLPGVHHILKFSLISLLCV